MFQTVVISLQKLPVIRKDRDLPKESSTPINSKHCDMIDRGRDVKAKTFLEFMFYTEKPPKPSPNKTRVLDNKFMDDRDKQTTDKETYSSKSTLPTKQCVTNHSVMDVKEEVKVVNVSIPLEVLEDFMQDDSFAEFHSKQIEASELRSTSANIDNNKTDTTLTVPTKVVQRSNTLPKENIAMHHGTRPSSPNFSHSKCLPNKIRKTENESTNCRPTSSCPPGNKQANQIDFNNRFSSDDEDMLLEAVALTESQISQGKEK